MDHVLRCHFVWLVYVFLPLPLCSALLPLPGRGFGRIQVEAVGLIFVEVNDERAFCFDEED